MRDTHEKPYNLVDYFRDYDKSWRKAFYKTISFRILAVISTFIVLYLFTGKIAYSLELTIILNIVKSVLYYVHERLWN